jgi:tellurite resistance protein TerC
MPARGLVNVPLWVWFALVGSLLALLMVDLFVVSRDPHELRLRESARWAALYVGLAVVFGFGLWAFTGAEFASQFAAGYLLEESLSVDNLFVFALIMTAFVVPPAHQHKVLLFGVIGSLVLRGLFIAVGVAVIEAAHRILIAFGVFLVATGIRLATQQETVPDVASNPLVRLVRRIVPTSTRYDGGKVLTMLGDRRALTPLGIAMIAIASMDVLFAVDSIPAVFGVTREPFLIFSANAFALIGLRSLYFLLAGAVQRLTYLNVGLALVLVFIGFKMVIEDAVKIPVWLSLLVIVVVMTATVVVSLWHEARQRAPEGLVDTA